MSKLRLVVLETAGQWAAALRRLAGDCPVLVREARTWEGCREELASAEACLVAIEITPRNLSQVIDWLAELRRGFPQAASVALLSAELAMGTHAESPFAEVGQLLREAGACHLIVSRREVPQVFRLANRLVESPQPG